MIKVLRVDDRLLHGQVAVAWTNYYKVDTIVIANDKVITDKTMQIAFKLATPPGITLSMKSLEGAVAVIIIPSTQNGQSWLLPRPCRMQSMCVERQEVL